MPQSVRLPPLLPNKVEEGQQVEIGFRTIK
jgi:hypothetical protein